VHGPPNFIDTLLIFLFVSFPLRFNTFILSSLVDRLDGALLVVWDVVAINLFDGGWRRIEGPGSVPGACGLLERPCVCGVL